MAGIVFGQANVPAIVVSTFSTRGQAVTADDAESITELFMAELAKQSGVRVVDRTSLDRVVAEMRFQTSDWSNSQKTAQLGAALNAEFLVRGQINQLGQQISFALTALDIKTLEVVSSSTQNFNSDTIFSNGSNGIFNIMYWMAQEIASPVKTKMVQLAEQKEKQQQAQAENSRLEVAQRENARLLVGRWQSIREYDNLSGGTRTLTCILEFRTDGSINVIRYDSGQQNRKEATLFTSWKYEYGNILQGRGSGNWSVDGDTITIRLNLTNVYGGNEFIVRSKLYWNDWKDKFSIGDGLLAIDVNWSWAGWYRSFEKVR
jgi:TolB-like protein